MSEFCPTCSSFVGDADLLHTYEWESETAVFCPACNTAERRKEAAPTLTAEDFQTTRVVQQGWKEEEWRVYLEVGDTPGSISFPVDAIIEATEGNANPIEWRLEREFNRRVELGSTAGKMARDWLHGPVEEHQTTKGAVSQGGRNE